MDSWRECQVSKSEMHVRAIHVRHCSHDKVLRLKSYCIGKLLEGFRQEKKKWYGRIMSLKRSFCGLWEVWGLVRAGQSVRVYFSNPRER